MKPSVQFYIQKEKSLSGSLSWRKVYEYINHQEVSIEPTIVSEDGLIHWLNDRRQKYQSLGFVVTISEEEEDE